MTKNQCPIQVENQLTLINSNRANRNLGNTKPAAKEPFSKNAADRVAEIVLVRLGDVGLLEEVEVFRKGGAFLNDAAYREVDEALVDLDLDVVKARTKTELEEVKVVAGLEVCQDLSEAIRG